MSMNTIIFTCAMTVVSCHAAYVYSSFYAPLVDPRILNYRVDVPFDPDAGKAARELYEQRYGRRGERLVADLGGGRAGSISRDGGDKVYGDVKLYYTYPRASLEQHIHKVTP